MSFSGDVKRELSKISPACKGCKRAMLYGIFLSNRISHTNLTLMHTEHKPVADCYINLLTELTGSIVTMFINDYAGPKQKRSYTVGVQQREDIERICRYFGMSSEKSGFELDERFLKKECCFCSFLRGIFMSCGSRGGFTGIC